MKINYETLEPVYANDLGSVKYDRVNRLLFGRFAGIPSIELIKDVFDHVLVYAPKNRITAGVYDLVQLKGTFTAANSYLTNQFLPVMQPLGYTYVGLVTSNNPFTKFAINALINLTSPKGLTMKMFNDLPSCEKWVFDQKEYKSIV